MSADTQTSPTNKPTDPEEFHKYRLWSPRFWHGMLVWSWLRLLVRNRMSISPFRIPMALAITLFTIGNSIVWFFSQLIFSRRVARTRITDAPVFIIGHWRTGTTFLHELLVLDERNTYPTTYSCFVPNHFLLTESIFGKLFGFLLPSRRPMDNMATGFSRPQEDEFALCNMGVPSPYLTMLFPNRPPQYSEYLDLENLSSQARDRWKSAIETFFKRITYRKPKRIISKSPTHTCRIKTLLEIFPDARFVHIVRDPYVTFPSTLRLWRSLYKFQALQIAKYKGLEQYVFETFEQMYEQFRKQRDLIHPSRFCEVRYEDLVQEPIGQMHRVYEELGLGDWEAVRPKLEKYLDELGDYKTNRYEISEETRDEITRRWAWYIKTYGYSGQPAGCVTKE